MKIDIHKAYDSANWSFIRLILLNIGLSIQSIRWIMVCITSVRYVVLINGLLTDFFLAERGLRHGCALSPLIFILIMDCFSNLMKMEKKNGYFDGLAFSPTVCVTHSLFVYDLLVFGKIIRNQWFYLH